MHDFVVVFIRYAQLADQGAPIQLSQLPPQPLRDAFRDRGLCIARFHCRNLTLVRSSNGLHVLVFLSSYSRNRLSA